MKPKALFYQCVDEGEMEHSQNPTISYEIIMQRRYEVARATIAHFKKPVLKSKNQHCMYKSDSSNVGPPPDDENVLNKTDTTEFNINNYL
jgi:hypothetical protein